MEKLNKSSEFNLIFKYALKDLSRNYKRISSIIVTHDLRLANKADRKIKIIDGKIK